ncbi:ATP-binding cassette sub-family F member 3-like isoform X1 [Lates japonicus]|uniref:ATP-binding cassette sub-family F member 3-like isoform X1 n=1 Tax=Lates japonicus TaxID=270547 RepID=A0AAD3NAU9_LATJO|nr:ATP-binding cassette sub-family F member 3-like isoform X1 [Lates japonicus]
MRRAALREEATGQQMMTKHKFTALSHIDACASRQRPGPGIMATYVDILKSEFPEIDSELFDYITGVLDSGGADFEDGEEVYDAIGGVLQEVSADSKNEDDVRDICLQMFNTLKLNNHHGSQKQVLLDAPVQLSQISADNVSAAKDVQGIWMMKRPQNTTVDAKKLEKAEAKLKAKHERRNEKDSQKASTPLVLEEASASQASSKKDNRVDQSGKNRSYDIRIENFDVSFGERCLLQGAELSLASGRRYGLIGRNGLGKTTLLKMLASRSLRVPAHISILHVEQEVAGDETAALQSVLESDTLREELLDEEKRLNARIASGNGDGTESIRLSEIYGKLEEIEADKAPARASVILGFPDNFEKFPIPKLDEEFTTIQTIGCFDPTCRPHRNFSICIARSVKTCQTTAPRIRDGRKDAGQRSDKLTDRRSEHHTSWEVKVASPESSPRGCASLGCSEEESRLPRTDDQSAMSSLCPALVPTSDLPRSRPTTWTHETIEALAKASTSSEWRVSEKELCRTVDSTSGATVCAQRVILASHDQPDLPVQGAVRARKASRGRHGVAWIAHNPNESSSGRRVTCEAPNAKPCWTTILNPYIIMSSGHPAAREAGPGGLFSEPFHLLQVIPSRVADWLPTFTW